MALYNGKEVRYIRIRNITNSSNAATHIVEIQAMDMSGVNRLSGKALIPITGSWTASMLGLGTDGSLTHTGNSGFVNANAPADGYYDLEDIYTLSYIRIWMYWDDRRTYSYTLETSIDNKHWDVIYDYLGDQKYTQSESFGRVFYFDRYNLIDYAVNQPSNLIGDVEIFSNFTQYSGNYLSSAFNLGVAVPSHSLQNPTYPLYIGFINEKRKSIVKSFQLRAQLSGSTWYPTRMPKKIDLEASDDLVTWTVLGTFEKTAGYNGDYFEVPTYNTFYQAYRLKFYSCFADYCVQSTIAFYGKYETGGILI